MRIELRQHENEHLHLADRPMSHAWRDHNAGARCHVHHIAVKLHLRARFALEKVVRLGETMVIVELRINRNVSDVDGGGKLRDVIKSPMRQAAGTFRSR